VAATSRDRWIGLIPYLPSDHRLWIPKRGRGIGSVPNAAKPWGLVFYVVTSLCLSAYLVLTIYAVVASRWFRRPASSR